jgi:hypothetical protein
MIPFFILGVLGCFYPYVYAVLPVHESDMCVCGFYAAMYSEGR